MKRILPLLTLTASLSIYHGFFPREIRCLMVMSFILILHIAFKSKPRNLILIIALYIFCFIMSYNLKCDLLQGESYLNGQIINQQGKSYLINSQYKVLLGKKSTEYKDAIIYVKFKNIYLDSNFHSFNYIKHLKSKGIDGVAESFILKQGSRHISLVTGISNHFDCNFKPQTSSLLKALILGDQSNLSDDFLMNIRKIQVAHIFAISGFHIALYYGIINAMLKLICLKKLWKDIMIILILFLYVWFLGMQYSALRALLMIIMYIYSSHSSRAYCMINSLALIILISQLVNPYIIFSLSFWMSNIAVFSIGTFYWTFKHKNNYLNKVLKIIGLPISVNILMLPFTIHYFNNAHLLSIPINILVGFIFSLLFPVSIFLIFLPFKWSYHIVDILYYKFNELLDIFSGLNGHLSNYPSEGLTVYILFVIIIILFYTFKSRKVFLISLMVPLVFFLLAYMEYNSLRMEFFDVGQGDAYYIEYQGVSILVDGGLGRLDLKPLLLKRGINHINYCIISHNHEDHYGGIKGLTEEGMVDTIIDNGNHQIKIGKLKVAIYDIFSDEINENNNSLLVKLKFGEFDFMGYGDGEALMEYQIIKRGLASDVDVLKISHHGSSTSSIDTFLRHIQPELGVIQVGYNYYGLPCDRAIHRLLDFDMKLLRTDQDGCVIIESDGETYQILTGVNYGL